MKYHLLIVDDEEQSRTTLSNCFPWKQVGFERISQASNGKLALDFIKRNEVHVLLCDIKMPIMNGIELAKELHNWKNPPIIVFFSGYRDFEYARQAMQYGVRFYMLKPIKYEDVIETFSFIKLELDKRFQTIDVKDEDIQDTFVANVRNYVKNNLETANLFDLSTLLFMNSSYVSQLYKQKTGQNFSEYLMEKRMEKAAKLLTSSQEKIYSISKQVGYTNAKNFSRTFMTYYGKTPSEYREQHRDT